MTKRERFQGVLGWFAEHMPIAETELRYTNPYELLVAVVLSAQCTDKRVNMVTPALFEAYPCVEDLARAEPEHILDFVRSVSYPNNKSRHLALLARKIVAEHAGQVPGTRAALEALPGVGRKTASVLLSVVFDTPALAVDTHVFRVAARLGLSTRAKTPLDTELQLTRYIPRQEWTIAHHWLILHGRYVCVARRPKCEECGLRPWCAYYARLQRAAARAEAARAVQAPKAE